MNTTQNDIIPQGLENEIKLRTHKIILQLNNLGIDSLLIASNANIFYACGRYFRGYILISTHHDPIYFPIKPLGLKGQNTFYIRKPEQIPEILDENAIPQPQNLALEFDALSFSEITRLKKIFPNAEFSNGNTPLRNARITKTEYEIEQMKQDGIHQAEVYRRIPHCWKEDMTDVELQAEIGRLLRLEGSLGYTRAFGPLMEINDGSLLAGENADNPSPYEFSMGGAGTSLAMPVGANGSIIHPGETIMVDMSGAFNGYQSDMTRTWRVGDIPQLAMKAHQCSIEILHTLEKIAKPGIKIADLYHRTVQIVEEQGLTEYFMGHKQKASFIGHGIGIDLNEPPVITPRTKEILQENMTIAIEPKFVIPHIGAVGIENTYVVRKDHLENITIFPEELAPIR
ncbi:MAG: Xaa-Pro peptidase family protein [Prevotella sp.]|nr:Xaa-Pro peptidase family protein [Bacteroides sp.]MCM1366752.1 Xaa-Pro peptidase family protein [Prevotella sp.]MCM1437371.1 Xaa-Pro peptidase family protein [Prevotella sp.]